MKKALNNGVGQFLQFVLKNSFLHHFYSYSTVLILSVTIRSINLFSIKKANKKDKQDSPKYSLGADIAVVDVVFSIVKVERHDVHQLLLDECVVRAVE